MAEERRKHLKKPDWLKLNFRVEKITMVEKFKEGNQLHPICSRNCPNMGECRNKNVNYLTKQSLQPILPEWYN